MARGGYRPTMAPDVTGLRSASRGDNRHCRRTISMCCGLALLSASTAACSLSFPLTGFKAENGELATGSINRSAGLLSPALDREDWRRAKAALAVALDPQGNGTGVAWQNGASGAKGSFTALAPPFLDHDRICRTFSAAVTPKAQSERRVAGSACRDSDGDWALRDVKDSGTS